MIIIFPWRGMTQLRNEMKGERERESGRLPTHLSAQSLPFKSSNLTTHLAQRPTFSIFHSFFCHIYFPFIRINLLLPLWYFHFFCHYMHNYSLIFLITHNSFRELWQMNFEKKNYLWNLKFIMIHKIVTIMYILNTRRWYYTTGISCILVGGGSDGWLWSPRLCGWRWWTSMVGLLRWLLVDRGR